VQNSQMRVRYQAGCFIIGTNGGGMKRADVRVVNYQTITNNERNYTL
jgi:hypothetical protein